MSVDTARALAITDGWMEPGELEWLAEHASRAQAIVEVGSWCGRSTMALACHTQGTIFAVDTWLGSEEHQGVFQNNPPDHVFKKFQENFWDHICVGRVIPVRLPSIAAASLFAGLGARFDMVFIDAAHDYDNIHADISAWLPLVRPNGLICGHDMGYPPIVRAVGELVGIVSTHHSIWSKRL
jgi:predicted O-methyltransferase YrrM